MPRDAASAEFRFRYALPELIDFLLLMLVWYILMRWLYFKPGKKDPREPALPSGDIGSNETLP
jgi:hypothetical protein